MISRLDRRPACDRTWEKKKPPPQYQESGSNLRHGKPGYTYASIWNPLIACLLCLSEKGMMNKRLLISQKRFVSISLFIRIIMFVITLLLRSSLRFLNLLFESSFWIMTRCCRIWTELQTWQVWFLPNVFAVRATYCIVRTLNSEQDFWILWDIEDCCQCPCFSVPDRWIGFEPITTASLTKRCCQNPDQDLFFSALSKLSYHR